MDTYTEQVLFKTIEDINTHITIINDELGVLSVDVAVLKTQITSILWLQRLFLGTIVVAVVGAILKLVIKKKNNTSS